jgi:hypothetical protein
MPSSYYIPTYDILWLEVEAQDPPETELEIIFVQAIRKDDVYHKQQS